MPLQCKNGQIAYSLPVKDKRATESNAITTTLTYNYNNTNIQFQSQEDER